MKFDKNLISKFKELNDFLALEYGDSLNIKNTKAVIKQIGTIDKICIKESRNVTLMGVDGSYNTYGANYPHQIWVFRGLAKATNKREVFNHHILTPLDLKFRNQVELLGGEKKMSAFDAANLVIKQKLAEMELEVALQGIDECKPDIIFMDGSLIRYKIECEEKWQLLKERVLEEKILLVGVIEEIGTKNLGKYFNSNVYDREILFGLLGKGEQLTLNKQIRDGFITTYLRPGEDPQPVALDCLEEQRESLPTALSLTTQLTPEKGRGIPIWIDIVDNEVRITDKIIEELAENYISPNIRYKFFSGKRKERWY